MGAFDGLVVLITGGASGIGAATARRFAEEGARIAILDRDTTNADPEFTARTVDITDDEGVRAAVRSIGDELGGIDIVINNAGIGAQGDIAANPAEEWLRVLDVNVVGIARVTSAALPYLRSSAHAAVVNTASIAATAGLPQRALYSASKGAVLALTRAMAADHLREGIRVNAVSPGTADTPWVGRLLESAEDPAAERAALNARQPSGRLVTADEVATAILHLADPRSTATTGTSLAVDGGMQELRLRPE
ncbi:SDR family NAD(P)-dependent oxidoreductase [Pseudolysinimonas sp.]|uniref:SDR family NAD(P)-dependent oxidoreductase n=1 Tax=Pseudolysinimonas sp. TaxID=2680009 RepID=UPI003F7EB044